MTAPRFVRVGVNLLWLVPGVVGGSEQYAVRLLGALGDHLGPTLEVVLFANRRFPGAYPELVGRFRTVVAPVSGDAKGLRVAAESTWLARAAVRHRVDLVHHLGGTLPLVQPTPRVVTIHDLQPLAMPEHFHPVKRAFHRVALPHAVRTADRVVTLAEHTRRDLVERLGADPAKVVAIPSGVAPDPGRPDQEVDEAVARYGLAGHPYVLYPAITYPHKNHRVLIEAFAAVHQDRPDVRLVLTHRPDRSDAAVEAQIEALGITEAVRRLGHIPAEDLDALYRRAAALAFPSRFEGFGLPVLEAMVRGCPVLAADATALPEVVGDAGVLVDPDAVEDWTEAMRSMFDDGPQRAALVAAGRARAASFSWEAAADASVAVWQEVLA